MRIETGENWTPVELAHSRSAKAIQLRQGGQDVILPASSIPQLVEMLTLIDRDMKSRRRLIRPQGPADVPEQVRVAGGI